MRSISLPAILVVTTMLITATSANAQTRSAAPKKATVAPAIAPAAAKPDLQGSPPELVIAIEKGRDKIELRRVVTRAVATVSEFKTAKGETVAQTEMRPVAETHSSVVDLSTFTVRRVDGRPVSKKDLTNRLTKPTPVLVMDPGMKYDDRFLALYKPDTLMLVEREPRRINPSASPEVAPASLTPSFTPTVANPPVAAPAVPDEPTATPTSTTPRRK